MFLKGLIVYVGEVYIVELHADVYKRQVGDSTQEITMSGYIYGSGMGGGFGGGQHGGNDGFGGGNRPGGNNRCV